MKIAPNHIYHVFNRGNNKQLLFFNNENYLYFLRKIRTHLAPVCDILAYCLMPNHFHFLIHMNEESAKIAVRKSGGIEVNKFSNGLRTVLSSYTRGVNIEQERTGTLFSQNTKVKPTFGGTFNDDYAVWCFRYIHQNPVKARLVNFPDKWPFSSYIDYVGKRNGTLCNQHLAADLLDFELNEFYEFARVGVPEGFEV